MLVTVYIPTKNRVSSLRNAVESVINQTYSDFELIVVDDGSNDETIEYLTQLTETNPKVRFYKNDVSKGACYSRNLAIKNANGLFVTGLDDDDEFEPQHLSALVAYWEFLKVNSSHKISCIYPQYLYRDQNGFSESNKSTKVLYGDMFKANFVGNQIFAPKEHFVDAGLFDEQMPAWQDLEFFYRVLLKFGEGRLMDLPTYIFDIQPRPDRISSSQKEKILKAWTRMVSLHAQDSPRKQQALLLQVYSEYYGFKVNLIDIIRFVKRGFLVKRIFRACKTFAGAKNKTFHLIRKVHSKCNILNI